MKEEKKGDGVMAEEEPYMFWIWAMASTIFRLFLIFFFPENINLSSRPEVSTPLTSLRRRTSSSLSLIHSLSTISITLTILFLNVFSRWRLLVEAGITVAVRRFVIDSSYTCENLNYTIVEVENRGVFFWSGSMYHGSPLLLSILGPLTIQR